MPKRYTAQQKEDVLRCLQTNNGGVMLTSIQTGVPERTIYFWQQRLQMKNKHKETELPQLPQQKNVVPPQLPPQQEPNSEEDDEDEIPAQFAELKKLR